jgi:aminopeptidase N
MENWGLLTFKSSVFQVNESSVLSFKQRCARLVCHEVVHQWFGSA